MSTVNNIKCSQTGPDSALGWPGHTQLGLKNATQPEWAPHLAQIIITMSVGSEWRRRFVQTNISGQTSSV